MGGLPENRVHPGRGEPQTSTSPAVVSRERPVQVPAKTGQMLLAQFAKRLHQEAAQPPRRLMFRGVVRRSGIVVGPILTVGSGRRSGRPLCWHLSRQAEDVGCVGPGGLEPGAVVAGERVSDGGGGR